jgi:hypothetical protein
MTKAATPPVEKPTVTVKGETKTLPEEEFWKRYSPHYEFPLSSVSSFALHAVGIAFLILLVVVAFQIWKEPPSPDIDAIAIEGGGGGLPGGVGGGPGSGDAQPRENVPDPADPKKPVPSVQLADLPVGPVDPIALPTFKDDTGERVIDVGNQALAQMAKLDETTRTKMFNGLAAGQGKGGTGSGGGSGSGTGTGTGGGMGEGKGKLSERQQRLLRWAMVFNTKDGRDYGRQLGLLGAQIAVPEGTGEYRLYTDLRNLPAKGEIADLSTMKSIYWIDDKPESVMGLCRALNIPAPPGPQVHFVAFFPLELEKELADMEMAYLQQKYPGKKLNDVDETRFEVRNNKPVITLMTMKGGR